jgi:hypothetical protein
LTVGQFHLQRRKSAVHGLLCRIHGVLASQLDGIIDTVTCAQLQIPLAHTLGILDTASDRLVRCRADRHQHGRLQQLCAYVRSGGLYRASKRRKHPNGDLQSAQMPVTGDLDL